MEDIELKVLKEINDVEAVSLLKEAIEIEGHKELPEQERRMTDFVAQLLEDYGLEVELQEVRDGRSNVLAYLRGEGEGPTLMYNSHLDTVPPYRMEIEPFKAEEREGRIYGRGSCDAKASLMAFIVAAKALSIASLPLKGDLLLVGAMGEESESMGTKFLVKNGPNADMAVIGEPTSMKVCIAHKGEINIHVTVHGRSAHSSTPHLGINAISKMGTAIVKLDEELPSKLYGREHKLLGGMTYSIALINGGVYPAVVPDRCELVVNVRLIPRVSKEHVIKIFSDILQSLRDIDPSLKFEIHYSHDMPPLETREDHPLVSALCNAISEITGGEAEVTGAPYHTDGGFLSAEGGIDTVILGPGDISQAHSPIEFVSVREYLDTCRVYALTALELLR